MRPWTGVPMEDPAQAVPREASASRPWASSACPHAAGPTGDEAPGARFTDGLAPWTGSQLNSWGPWPSWEAEAP